MSSRVFLAAKWEYLAMLNYEVDPEILKPHLPPFTEIDYFDVQRVVVHLHDVLQFEISVDDLLTVTVVNRGNDLLENGQSLVLAKLLFLLEELQQFASFQMLHDEVRLKSLFDDEEIQNFDDVRVNQTLQSLCL